ncbi:MAG: hypothetical protein JJU29_18705 [Verrucomicrobia bacterium]|nr:hypothetical protein [Verrucomicrobiota bacterium]MCH8511372.1 hypothetical protein [Kiritimatiellia bacterium]
MTRLTRSCLTPLRQRDLLLYLVCFVVFLWFHPQFLPGRWGVGMRGLGGLHENFRTTVAALAMGCGLIHLIIRVSPALFEVTGHLSEEEARNRGEIRLRRYARWFIAMRWIAVVVASMLVYLIANVFRMLPGATQIPLQMVIGSIAVANIVFMFWERRMAGPRPLLLCQLYLDLIFFTLLLHYTGGVENPLAIFIIFHVVIAGILLERMHCYLIAAAGSLLYAGLSLGEWAGWWPHYSLQLMPHDTTEELGMDFMFVSTVVAVQVLSLFLAAYFVTTLSQRLREGERQLVRLADKALEERALLEQALETTCTGLRVLSADLIPERCNVRWSSWFGRGGKDCQFCRGVPENFCPARECLEANRLHVIELKQEIPGESPAIFQVSTAPLHDANGVVRQVVQLARDITEQKESHERMMRAGQLAAVGELAGQVAHEVNNPIAILHGKCELLLQNHREEMSENVARELRKISEQSLRVAHIARGLLSYARPMPSVPQVFDLRVAVRKALAFIGERAKKQGITIEDRLPETPVHVNANPSELEQIFLNLALNSIQAMPEGGALLVASDVEGEQIRVMLEDTGPGIPQEIREKVFEPFFTTKQDGRGTGLGLSICQGLLRSHQGNIHVESGTSGGCRMVVCLPAQSNMKPESPKT